MAGHSQAFKFYRSFAILNVGLHVCCDIIQLIVTVTISSQFQITITISGQIFSNHGPHGHIVLFGVQ